MSGREWKPGDVALIPFARGHVRGMYTADGWVCSDMHYPAVHGYTDLRPLVVIDPVSITGPNETGEDGDPLTEIANCLRRLAEGDHPRSYRRRVAERLAEVFDPTPPKPDEPQGLGAVVEDEQGLRWTRVESGEAETRNPWYPALASVQPAEYADISAVRVLSPGVEDER
jgi:hypothetical protein